MTSLCFCHDFFSGVSNFPGYRIYASAGSKFFWTDVPGSYRIERIGLATSTFHFNMCYGFARPVGGTRPKGGFMKGIVTSRQYSTRVSRHSAPPRKALAAALLLASVAAAPLAAWAQTKSNPVCPTETDRKSTGLNSSHTEIYTLSLHDALPISTKEGPCGRAAACQRRRRPAGGVGADQIQSSLPYRNRSEEHRSELQSHRDLHSFPTRRSSDLHQGRPLRPRCCLPASPPPRWRRGRRPNPIQSALPK